MPDPVINRTRGAGIRSMGLPPNSSKYNMSKFSSTKHAVGKDGDDAVSGKTAVTAGLVQLMNGTSDGEHFAIKTNDMDMKSKTENIVLMSDTELSLGYVNTDDQSTKLKDKPVVVNSKNEIDFTKLVGTLKVVNTDATDNIIQLADTNSTFQVVTNSTHFGVNGKGYITQEQLAKGVNKFNLSSTNDTFKINCVESATKTSTILHIARNKIGFFGAEPQGQGNVLVNLTGSETVDIVQARLEAIVDVLTKCGLVSVL